ncbi:MAG: V-type ATP synthase subunit I [Candidatus Pelethousia sp.]|nr:V-type ATP synthase subunit I [Candidatus Pelethousia sp.]
MIVPIQRLTLIGRKADESALLGALQALAAVQIIPAEEGRESALLPHWESRVQRLQGAQLTLKKYADKQGIGPKPEMSATALAEALPASLELCAKVEELERAIAGLRAEADKRRALIAQLRPWEDLAADMAQIRHTRSVRYITGFLQAEQVDLLAGLEAVVEVYGAGREKAVLIACLEGKQEEVLSLVKGLNFREYAFPGLCGTPAENIRALEGEAADLVARAEALQAELASLGKERPALCFGQDAALIERDLEAGKGQTGATDTTFILEGWAREDQRDDIEAALSAVTDLYYIDFSEPAEDETPPTVLRNKPLVAPYEAVTNLYSLPAYGAVDATPLFMPFYFIFFGMMLTDTGYGILLAIGAALFLKYMKPQGMMAGLAGVLMQGGISTIFMGLLFGSFFGVTWPVIFRGLPFENTFPLIDSSTEPLSMLAVCAGLGIVHMFFAVLIATYRCIKAGDWWGAIIDNFCWILIISGALLLAAPMLGFPGVLAVIGKWMAILAALAVFLFAGRSKKTIAGRLLSGGGKLYDIAAWLGDVLSYARIFALGLSTGVIGLVLNILCWDMLFAAFKGNMVMTVIGFIITAALSVSIHLFMMAISTLGCFVHTARLQYVEFFGKFYESGGKPFRPLRYATRHSQVAGK